MRTAFWSLNGGIALTMVLSMLPTGLFQFYQSFHYDLWHARSGQFVEDPLLHCVRVCVCVCVVCVVHATSFARPSSCQMRLAPELAPYVVYGARC